MNDDYYFDLKNIKRIYRNDKDYIIITWYMTSACNYRCEYCPNVKDVKFPSKEDINSKADYLNKLIEESEYDKFQLFLTGGETTCLDLEDIFLSHITSKKVFDIHITTNFSKSLDYYKHLKAILYEKRNINIQYAVSIHQSQVKNLDELIDKIINVANAAEIVVTNENCRESIDILDKIKSKGFLDNSHHHLKVDICRENNIPIKLTDENNGLIKPYFNTSKSSYFIHYLNNETKKFSRTEIQNKLSSFNFYMMKCRSNRFRFSEDGKLYHGSCGVMNKNEITKFEKKQYICTSKKCNMCNLLEVSKFGR